jgi:hypothetical protein
MTVASRRSKMVSFRVSMEEYQLLEEACMARRVRSISESARDAVRQWIGVNASSGPLDGELQQVERRIHALAKELERLQHLARVQSVMPFGTTAAQ